MEYPRDFLPSQDSGVGSQRGGTTNASQWFAFGAGMVAAMVAMYLAVTRPIANELARLQGRIVEIDKSLRAVAGQRETARAANDLLSLLAEQGRRTGSAADALEDIRQLHAQLAKQTGEVERAVVALENLSLLKTSLLQTAPQLEEAAAVLTAVEDVEQQLLDGRSRVTQARQALAGFSQLSAGAISLDRQTAQRSRASTRLSRSSAALWPRTIRRNPHSARSMRWSA